MPTVVTETDSMPHWARERLDRTHIVPPILGTVFTASAATSR